MKCQVCDSDLEKKFLNGLLKCDKCGFVSADLLILPQDLLNLYSINYFNHGEYRNYLEEKKELQKNFKKRINVLVRLLPLSKRLKLFEIGCSYGFFLELAKNYFSEVTGIDISLEATNYARSELGLSVATGDFLEYNLNYNYDVYCLWDTIEHLVDSKGYIKKISENINKNGVIAITTGDIGSFFAKINGRKWRLIHPPTHLHYFSIYNLNILLKRFGFTIIYKSHPGFYRSLSSVLYGLFSKDTIGKRIYKYLKPIISNFTTYINFYDIMYIIAKKL